VSVRDFVGRSGGTPHRAGCMVEEDYRFQVVIERGQARVFKNSVEAEHGI